MFTIFSGLGGILARVFIRLMKVFGIIILLTALGYFVGIFLEIQGPIAISLNNGFYYIGLDLQYNFAETFAAIGFLVGFIVSAFATVINFLLPPRQVAGAPPPSKATETQAIQGDIDLNELALLVPMVNSKIEKELYKIGINSVPHLANAKPGDIAEIVGGSSELATLLIADAEKVLSKIHGTPMQ